MSRRLDFIPDLGNASVYHASGRIGTYTIFTEITGRCRTRYSFNSLLPIGPAFISDRDYDQGHTFDNFDGALAWCQNLENAVGEPI